MEEDRTEEKAVGKEKEITKKVFSLKKIAIIIIAILLATVGGKALNKIGFFSFFETAGEVKAKKENITIEIKNKPEEKYKTVNYNLPERKVETVNKVEAEYQAEDYILLPIEAAENKPEEENNTPKTIQARKPKIVKKQKKQQVQPEPPNKYKGMTFFEAEMEMRNNAPLDNEDREKYFDEEKKKMRAAGIEVHEVK